MSALGWVDVLPKTTYLARQVCRRGYHRLEGEPVQRVGDRLGLSVDVNHPDVGRGEGAREGRGSPRRLACPVEVRGSESLGRLNIFVPESALREPLRDLLDRVVQGLLRPSVHAHQASAAQQRLTSQRARYGRCQVRNKMEECVQYPPKPLLFCQLVLLPTSFQGLYGMPWIPAI